MITVTEYFATFQVTSSEFAKMNSSQLKMLDRMNGGSTANLQSALNALSLTAGVIGLFLTAGAATVAGLVSATSGVAGSLSSYDKAVANLMQAGCNSMGILVGDLQDLTKYDIFEISGPFIDFKNDFKYIRYVQGSVKVVSAHVKGGGWVSMQ